MKKFLTSILILSFSLSINAQEITDQTFLGKWCGKWDGIYSVCFTINSLDENALAHYEWVEKEGETFNQTEKKLKRINRNTLKIDNIYFVVDENNLAQASGVGIFLSQTRMALLLKQK